MERRPDVGLDSYDRQAMRLSTYDKPRVIASAEDHPLHIGLPHQELVNDERRDQRICDDVVQTVRDGRSPLVLTERNEHLDGLARQLSERVRHLVVLRGGMGRKHRQAVAEQLAAIPADEERVLIATGKYIGEGFDDPRLDTLFLTLPVSWRGTIAQCVGRRR